LAVAHLGNEVRIENIQRGALIYFRNGFRLQIHDAERVILDRPNHYVIAARGRAHALTPQFEFSQNLAGREFRHRRFPGVLMIDAGQTIIAEKNKTAGDQLLQRIRQRNLRER
jgi:hypothetical protein